MFEFLILKTMHNNIIAIQVLDGVCHIPSLVFIYPSPGCSSV
jgi:hypothetical protein